VECFPNAGLYRRATAAALVVAPLLALADNLLHPKEFTRDHEAQQLDRIADAYTRWQLAHALGFLAIVIFAAATLGLAFLVARRRPRLGLIGGALAITGLIGLASVITIDGYTWGTLGGVSRQAGIDQPTLQRALHEVQQSSWSLLYYTVPALWIAGTAVLAIAAARFAGVPGWAGALLAIGALLVGTETAVTSNAYFIASSIVFLAGSAAVGVFIARMSDVEFAGFSGDRSTKSPAGTSAGSST
jgi:hypothetical protein